MRLSTTAIWAISPRSVRPPLFSGVTINRARDRSHHVHKAWLVRDLNAQAVQIVGKVGAAGRERNLGQKPKGMEECRVFRGGLESPFRGGLEPRTR